MDSTAQANTESKPTNPSVSAIDLTFSPGENCWRVENANRLGVVIDTADYFKAFRSACEQAHSSIFILGWDFDRLEKTGREENDPNFEDFLCGLLEKSPDLHIYLLLWDFNMIYAAEREWFQSWRLRLGNSSRLHVHFDARHPVGASHHQKLVVVDDSLAFCGGIDLSRWRWDTSAHRADEPRRTDASGKSYPPFHDVMCVVDGDAAGALAELARLRWQWSSSSDTPVEPRESQTGAWPDDVNPLCSDQAVAIARTLHIPDKDQPVREVEQLYLDSIAAARQYIYIENQYFTSNAITRALANRLREESPPEAIPEVIMVLPHHTGGWLEQVTMDELRQRQLQRLIKADRHKRLRVYYPTQPGLPNDQCISVHAKLVIIDDSLVHIGSANTSNRSMGLDSECNLAWQCPDGNSAAWLLHRLLSEHLGCSIEEFANARGNNDSLAHTVSSLRQTGQRSLEKLVIGENSLQFELDADSDVIDPNEPVNAEYFVQRAIPEEETSSGRRQLMVFVGFLLLMLLLAAAWRWTPLADWITPQQIERWLGWFNQPWLRFAAVFAVIVVTSLLMVPLSLLVIASAVLLGPWAGFACSMAAALLSGWIAFLLGDALGGKVIHRLSGSQIHALSQRLSERGILAVAVLRLLPVAPYTVVNLAAGASHLGQVQFMLGSAIGLLPGIGALTLFSGSLVEAVKNPSPTTVGAVVVVIVVIAAAALVMRRMLRKA